MSTFNIVPKPYQNYEIQLVLIKYVALYVRAENRVNIYKIKLTTYLLNFPEILNQIFVSIGEPSTTTIFFIDETNFTRTLRSQRTRRYSIQGPKSNTSGDTDRSMPQKSDTVPKKLISTKLNKLNKTNISFKNYLINTRVNKLNNCTASPPLPPLHDKITSQVQF